MGRAKGKYWIILAIFFILTLGLRLYFSFSTPYFSSDSAYFNIRQIEAIKHTGVPIYSDPLSFSGRELMFPPMFNYILALFSFVMPVSFAAKLIPNIFASCLVILTFLIAGKITDNRHVALFAAFVSGFVPIYFNQTFNSVSVYTLVVPLIFLLIYAFMNIEKPGYIYTYVGLLLFLAIVHPSVILFVAGLLVYMSLMRLEHRKYNKKHIEVVLFSTFFVLWIEFLLFKDLFLFYGPAIVWQNIPAKILSRFFSDITILEAVYKIGVIPFMAGVYIVYRYIFKEKNRNIYFLISLALAAGILLWLRLIALNLGLIFLGLILVLLFAKAYSLFLDYVSKTKMARFSIFFTIILALLFIVTSVLPSLTYANRTVEESITEEEINALEWIKESTADSAVVLATVEEGNLITAVAERRNVIDSNFIFISDAKQRYNNVESLFVTRSVTDAVSLANKYDIDYIYFSEKAQKEYGINKLYYIEGDCFKEVYSGKIKIYKSSCILEELSK